MTLKEHKLVAKQIRKIRKKIMACYSGDKKFRKIYISEMDRLNNIVSAIDVIKSTLDDSYHRLITDKQFRKLGHIYYDDWDNENPPYVVLKKKTKNIAKFRRENENGS